MSPMGGMSMSGGTMMWTRMPGQTWPGAAVSFLGMWFVMMAVMMTPSLVPTLWRYGRSVRVAGRTRTLGLTALVSIGYFCVWTAMGAVLFPLGVAVAAVEAREHLAPITISVVVLIAGLVQQTAWKARQLAHCRDVPSHGHALADDAGAAWRYGVCLGLHCVRSCVGLTAISFVLGIMDLRVMAAVTAAITAERLAPSGVRVARFIGVMAVVAGCV